LQEKTDIISKKDKNPVLGGNPFMHKVLERTNIMFKNSITKKVSKSTLIKQEFEEKNVILQEWYKPLTPYDYYQVMFGTLDREFTYVLAEDKTYKKTNDFDELLEIGSFRSDIYVHPCRFFNNYVNYQTLEKLYAFTIDLDHLSPKDLLVLLNFKIKKMPIKPTLIMNSGQGVHLVYVLSSPVDCFNKVKGILRAVLRCLKAQFTPNNGNSYVVDKKTSLIQSYRLLGSLTKAGQRARGFQSGVKVDIADLAAWVGVEWKVKPREEREMLAVREDKPRKVEFMANTRRAFYDHVASRIPFETQEGNRYMALVALAIVGYKCKGVSKDEVLKDITMLVDWYNDRDQSIVADKEIKKAMKGYSQKYLMTPSTTLEEYLGFEFKGSKRNGRKRKDHLEMARAIKDAKLKVTKKQQIAKYLQKSPSASANEIVNALKMSKPTVCKYLREIRADQAVHLD
jgi:hypothetical protein